MEQEEINIRALGVILHVGHLMAGYKEEDVAEFAKGYVMGITAALEMAGKVDSNILPEGNIPVRQISYGVEAFFEGYYYSHFIDRTAIQDPIDAMNQMDFSETRRKAKNKMLRLAGSNQPFFVDPGKIDKQ